MPELELFCIRGAYSTNFKSLKLGVDLFENEEIHFSKWDDILKLFSETRPKIVITHEAPHICRDIFYNISRYSLTSHMLQELLEAHRPDLWVFGHHHKSIDKTIPGYRTRFICLKEFETFKI